MTTPASSSSASAAATAPAGSPVRRAIWSALTGASAIAACTGASRGSTGSGAAAARRQAEHGEGVAETRDGQRTQTEQVIRAARERRGDLARDRKHLAALVEREIGGDQRTAALARLDDERRLRQSGHDSVARRESPGRRLDTRRVLGDDQPAAATWAASAVWARG